MTEYVTDDKSLLRMDTGYWSENKIYYNPTDKIIINKNISKDLLKELLETFFRSNILDAVERRLYMSCGSNSLGKTLVNKRLGSVKNYFRCKNLSGFEEFRKYVVSSGSKRLTYSVPSPATWSKIGWYYNEKHPKFVHRQVLELAEIMVKVAENDPEKVFRYSKPLGPDIITLSHPDLSTWIQSTESFKSILTEFVLFSSFRIRAKSKKDVVNIYADNKACLDIYYGNNLRIKKLSTVDDAIYLLNLVNGIKLLLVYLARNKYIYLPSMLEGYASSVRVLEEEWYKEDIPSYSIPLLSRILISSSIDSVDDFPQEAHILFNGIKEQRHINSLFKILLMRSDKWDGYKKTANDRLRILSNPGESNNSNYTPWPVEELHRLKKKRNKKPMAWSPDRLKEEGYSEAWVEFASIAWKMTDTSTRFKRQKLVHLLPWAKENQLNNPADIKPNHLRDVNSPDNPTTFYKYVSNLPLVTKNTVWAVAENVFRVVTNHLKLEPSPLLPIKDSPFETIDNPFKSRCNHKTVRNRLPSAIQEAMIDVLLEPDEQGVPTYRWVKEDLRWDWFYWINKETGKKERIWCPSRSACLALLLLLPIRVKQARWLDRGLMDGEIWDIESGKMVPNSHKLVSWRYANGDDQLERNGRFTGVLQPVYDPLNEEQELGIYINTNKTQLWDPENTRGYEIPWPTGELLKESENADVREQGIWLERPYSVLKQQINWQNKYNKSPEPVTFFDVPDDADSVADNMRHKMPYFAPLFADILAPYQRNDKNKTIVHAPVSYHKITRLFHALAAETERRFLLEGRSLNITDSKTSRKGNYKGKKCIFDLHSLRVAGISRLIEMGVPVHIVQEFIVGHTTIIMTYYYKKHNSSYIRMKLLDSMEESGLLGDWDVLKKELSDNSRDLLVNNPKYREYLPDDLFDTYPGWKMVPGGLCPLGGAGCDIGRVKDVRDAPKRYEKIEFTHVIGGCGNCRFFTTGPAFLIQQAQASNEIMLECRALGKERLGLYNKLSEYEWDDDVELSPSLRKKLNIDREIVKDQIKSINEKLEPLVLEWFNRYLMFKESQELMGEWEQYNSDNKGKRSLLLLSEAMQEDLAENIEVRLERAGDFSLVRNILESAKLRGGISKSSTLSKAMLRDFMDRILRADNSRHLLIDIPDENVRNEVAYYLASFAEDMVGDASIQASLDKGEGLKVTQEERERWLSWVDDVVLMSRTPKMDLKSLLPKINELRSVSYESKQKTVRNKL